MMSFVALTPYWAKATRGVFSRSIHRINSMIVWSLTVLRSEFRFRTILLLGVYASDALDPLMVRVVLRIAPGWAHHVDVVGFDNRVPTSTTLDLRVVFSGF
jgi:hypothetical protein